MANHAQDKWKTIIDRERLMKYNAEGCAACGRKFNLGEPVVYACGDWIGPPKPIHENEAVFDQVSESYIEKRYYEARK